MTARDGFALGLGFKGGFFSGARRGHFFYSVIQFFGSAMVAILK